MVSPSTSVPEKNLKIPTNRMMNMLRKSFKNTTSFSSSPSASPTTENHQSSLREAERWGLLHSDSMVSDGPFGGGGGGDGSNDVVVKITPRAARETELATNAKTSSSTIWKDSSYDFSNDLAMRAIANNNKDFDFGTDSPMSRIPENAAAGGGSVRRRSNASGSISTEEVVINSGNTSLQRRSSLIMPKPKSRLGDSPEIVKSRLMDPPEDGRMSQMMPKSGELEEDDPFKDDLPEEYKKVKFSKLTILQLVSLILILAALACSLSIRFLRKRTLFELELWKWELMILVLICGRLFSGWLMRGVVFIIERNFLLRKKVLYFVYGLRNAAQNVVWLALVLLAWHLIFDKRVERLTNILPTVTKIWVCLLVSTVVWLVKTTGVKALASQFHVDTYFDRIQEALFNQYVIEALSGPPLVEMWMKEEEDEKVIDEVRMLQNAGAKLPNDLKASVFQTKSPTTLRSPNSKSPSFANGKSFVGRSPTFKDEVCKKEEGKGISIDHLHRMNQNNVSAWNMKRLTNIVRKGVLSTLDETLQNNVGEDETSVQITSETKAIIAAKKIFTNVAKPGSKFIHMEDLMRFMKEDEAQKTMHLLDTANNGTRISKRALKNWVVNAFKERRDLRLSLDDTKTAVKKLHGMVNIIVLVLLVVIWLLILRVASMHIFLAFGSQALLAVFVFGNTLKTTFEAIIFLFVMHPFDVGDRVEVFMQGQPLPVQMVVEEMNILTTVFLRYDNLKITYPNSVLATTPICNFRRSPPMGDSIDFSIHISTPMDKIALMNERIISWIENNKEHWNLGPMIVMREIEDMNRLRCSLWPSHTINFQEMGERFTRRSRLVGEMIKVFKDLDIEYRMLPAEVNMRNLPAPTSTRVPSNWSRFSN